MRDYYCSRKFYSFKLDLEKKNLYNCCKSDPENIDITSLEENSKSMFNTETLVKERQSMLNNDRIQSCEKGCWIAEDQKKWSLRLQTESNKKTHLEAIALPEELDLQLSGDCNLTCSYCCKEFSSAWRKDIIKHGDYNCEEEQRYNLKKIDMVLEKLSQRNRENSRLHKFIKNKLGKDIKNLSKLLISGGEPFIHNNLLSYIDIFKNVPDIKIVTGLGISKSRLVKILDNILKYKNIKLVISAESIGKNYEFNRYGNTYIHFTEILNVIQSYSINYAFNTTYSNLTIFDYVKFYKKYEKIEKTLNLVYDPTFMSVNVLDDASKDIIREDISNSPFKNSEASKSILSVLNKTCTDTQRKNLEVFIKEFCKRRNIKPDFMPDSLKRWLNLL
jgi:organic radical activating enzyme